MKLSVAAKKEFLEFAQSESLRRDMAILRAQRHNPFVRDGKVDIDAYIDFVTQFNEFIDHRPKPFQPMIDKEMWF